MLSITAACDASFKLKTDISLEMALIWNRIHENVFAIFGDT